MGTRARLLALPQQYQPTSWKILLFCVLACGTFLVLVSRYSNADDILRYAISANSTEYRGLPLSVQCNFGRLGNQMCTYASLLGISAANGRSFIPLRCNVDKLTPYFRGVLGSSAVEEKYYIKKSTWNLVSYLRTEDRAIPPDVNFLLGFKYPCSYTFYDHVRQQVRDAFRFRPDIAAHARMVLAKANVHHHRNAVYVGVHVRRGDYPTRWLAVFDGVPVTLQYFERAFEYFRGRYSPVVFVLVSDDRLWCIANLSRYGVYVAEDAPSPAHDLAVLAACNHTVMTYGTFGFWGAYLAGGEVVYYDKFLRPDTEFVRKRFIFDKMYLPDWKGIATINDSYWRNNSNVVAQEGVTHL